MKTTISLIIVLIGKLAFGQTNANLESFNSKFALVAGKSTAWNTLIDHLKPTNSLKYYKLTTDTVWKDPCQHIQQQGSSCPQIDYLTYFKRADGSESIFYANGYEFVQNYRFETNSRPGNDIVTNIDTIRYANFSWTMNLNSDVSKNQVRKAYMTLFDDICTGVNTYYGSSTDELTNKNILKSKYWPYRNGVGTLARIVLLSNPKTNQFRIQFSGNIQSIK